MPRFDLRDRDPAVPVKTVLHPDGRERIFVLPYDTIDPADLKLLRKHPLLVESATPVPEKLKPLPKEVTTNDQQR